MTIKEVEEKTGLTRSNIRFYEKEKLIQPIRNESNGYREYTEKDVEDIKKIACLRTLGISIETIHRIILKEISLRDVIGEQMYKLDAQVVNLEKAKIICQSMLADSKISYENLDVEAFVRNWKHIGNLIRKFSGWIQWAFSICGAAFWYGQF